MGEWVNGVIKEVDAEVVVRLLAKKGWAEKNFQVSTSDKRLGNMQFCSRRCRLSYMEYSVF